MPVTRIAAIVPLVEDLAWLAELVEECSEVVMGVVVLFGGAKVAPDGTGGVTGAVEVEGILLVGGGTGR